MILIVAAIGSCAAPLIFGGLTSLLRDLVPNELHARTYGLDATSYNAAGIAGPVMAGVLATTIGPVEAVLGLALSSLIAAAAVATIPTPSRTRGRHDGREVGPVAAVVLIWRDRILSRVTFATTMAELGLGALPVIAALLSIQQNPGYTAAYLTAVGVGALLGSLAYTHRPVSSGKPERVVVLGLLGTGLTTAAATWAAGFMADLIAFAIAGFFTGPMTSTMFNSRDQRTPPTLHGQVFTLTAGLRLVAGAVGAAGAGIAADLGSSTLLLIVAGCHFIGAASIHTRRLG